MRYLFGILGIGAMLVAGIYASGGTTSFMANLLSTQGTTEEVIDFRAMRSSSTRAGASQKSTVSKKANAKTITPSRPMCIRGSASVSTEKPVRINEVAWMGSAGDTKKEWIELKNISSSGVVLTNWQLVDKSGSIKVDFNAGHALSAGAFLVVSRGTDFSGTINNSDEALYLYDSGCSLIDEVVANPGWSAGNVKEEKTAERDVSGNWYTSTEAGGTKGEENDKVPISNEKILTTNNSLPTTSTEVTILRTNNQQLTTIPKILISEIMAGKKGDADYDFVELYNVNDESVALTGWSIKKRSSTGKLSALVSATRMEGVTIAGHGLILLANEKGYAGTPSEDVAWPASYSLASENNSIVLYNASGIAVDEVSWQKIPDGQSWVRDSWTGSSFHAVSVPTPRVTNAQ